MGDSEDEDRITEVNDDGSKKEDDDGILEFLWDISLAMDEAGIGFTLSFHFHPNCYFSNSVLTKHYSMKCTPEKEDPFSFEGPEICKCEGCKINWSEGKNVTVKQVKKKVKKGKDKGKTITKEVKADSFFHFFSPPAVPDDPEAEVDEELQDHLQRDFQIGHYLRERVVPRAVLFYTGEEQEDDMDDEDEDEEEEESDDEDEGSEEENDRPKLKARKGKGRAPGAEGEAPECKQQ